MTVAAPADAEAVNLQRARSGDEIALRTLVRRHHGAMMCIARRHAGYPGEAEELVMRTWLTLLLDRHDLARTTSVKTLIIQCLLDAARVDGVRADAKPSIPGTRVRPQSEPMSQISRVPPAPGLVQTRASAAIASLPAGQREVIVLRDVEGWTAAEVGDALGLRDVDQRALLHQARGKVRNALAPYFEPT